VGRALVKKVGFIYNPISGPRLGRRLSQIEIAAQVLKNAGTDVTLAATTGPATGGEQARSMVLAGCDTIFACGGDGTIHDVAQGLVASRAALAIIPLGTANSLAHDLGIPRSPAAAARAALYGRPQRIPLGKVEYTSDNQRRSRYFIVAFGAGADAHMFYRLDSTWKRRHGMKAYYAQALQLWLTHRLPRFQVEYLDARGDFCQAIASQVLAVRISDFGGVLRNLAPGAALSRQDLRVVLFKTASRFPYLLYVTRTLLDGRWSVPGVELLDTGRLICRPMPDGGDARIYAETDGELLSRLPVEVSVVPDAITLVVPQEFATENLRDHRMATAMPPVGDPVS
jgi:diacylglycerol kinase (ATP)